MVERDKAGHLLMQDGGAWKINLYLRALVDARWWSVARRAVKCGNDSRYAFYGLE
ncbi:hypothetical protein TIFTF001_043264 [Ficus carica]|uniref:Uncharacterized protein n=1 Tax=Ficus carica TaxID=3494 RepID=A0AA87YR28_FICCA|nr:hypothetical protein TIFTF001_043264 [Ficus carica]